MLRMLNLGCGDRYHADWTNVDMQAAGKGVIVSDLRSGIPFPDCYFDAVYHSHLLEHLPRHEAYGLIDECYRVLKPRGIIRVVVPDLEAIAREYLRALELIDAGDERGRFRYEWILLELYDQVVRTKPGGEMLQHLRQADLQEADYVIARTGTWAERIVQDVMARQRVMPQVSILRRIVRFVRARKRVFSALKKDFRQSGEIHQWMYDRYSLSKLVSEAGFGEIRIVGSSESRIEGWSRYLLDTEADGRTAKPDSLYLEAVRPA
ncbi:MAG: class I SAM-dependent methyltransferase [Blastocatellia bacterium]